MIKAHYHRALRSRDDIIVDVAVLAITLLVCALVLYPLVYVLSSSFSDPSEVAAGNVILFPKGFTLEGYSYILDYDEIWTGYRNTLFYTIAGTLLNLIATLPAAYALSRRDLFGRGIFTVLFTVTMFFSGGLIPTYLVYKQLNLLNTVWIMLIPGLVSMWNTVVCRTYFSNSIPYELQEASKIDGCNDFILFFRIVLPLSAPIIAVMAMYYAVGHWNSYFNAMIYLRDTSLYPLQLVLRSILLLDTTSEMIGADAEGELLRLQQLKESMKYGVIVISALPMLVMYPFFQKYFVKGVMVGAIKG